MKRSHDYAEPNPVELDPRAKASSYLKRCGNKKPFIAIDLDFTLWETNCFEHTQGPYTRINESDPMTEVSCFDRRTHECRKLSLFSEARQVLEWCLDNGILLTIASSSPSKELVEEILVSFNMLEWFFMPQVFNSRKSYHFRNLVEYSGFKTEDFLFFDDSQRNIDICESMGITCVHVDEKVGLNWESLLKGLKTFSRKNKRVVRFGSWSSMSSSSSDCEKNPVVICEEGMICVEDGNESDHSVFEDSTHR